MVIGSVAGMAQSSLGDKAFLAVAILAVGNAAGRIAAGSLSDKYGRKKTLGAVFTGQALLMFAAIPITSATASNVFLLVLLATAIGFNYGANLALFPAFAKDNWGMKNFGVNYGLLFTAWGVAGLVMSRTSQTLMVKSGTYTASFLTSGILLVIGVLIIWKMCEEKEEIRRKVVIQLNGPGAA
jgi:MFS family permease